ncbi:MAG: FIG00816284: hypothetical protein, partial [uncultured Corynebacteriales bacterium]
ASDDREDPVRRLHRRGAGGDEGACRRTAGRGQEGRQEGGRPAGGPGPDRGDGTGGPGAGRARARDGDRGRPGPVPEDLVRHAVLRGRRRQGRRLLPGRGQVQVPLLHAGFPGHGESRRRRPVAGVVRAGELEPRGRGEGRPAGHRRDLL